MIARVLVLLALMLPTLVHGETIVPQELWAPGQSIDRGDCPTYDGNQFLWGPVCGGATGGGACHTHPCVNQLCFDPRVCPSGYYAGGVGPNGDAICRPFPTPTVTETPLPTLTPTPTATSTATPTTTATPGGPCVGGSGFPVCDGTCPAGLSCQPQGASCDCEPGTFTCEEVNACIPTPTVTETPTATPTLSATPGTPTATPTTDTCGEVVTCETPTPQWTPPGAVVFVGSDAQLTTNPDFEFCDDAGKNLIIRGGSFELGASVTCDTVQNEIGCLALTGEQQCIISTVTEGNETLLENYSISNTADTSTRWTFGRSRGTLASALPVQGGDRIWDVEFAGNVATGGSPFLGLDLGARMRVVVAPSPSPSTVPMNIEFWVGATSATLRKVMEWLALGDKSGVALPQVTPGCTQLGLDGDSEIQCQPTATPTPSPTLTQTPTPTPTTSPTPTATVTTTATITTTPTPTTTITPTPILTPSRSPTPTTTIPGTPTAVTPTPTVSPTPNTAVPLVLPIVTVPSDGVSYFVSTAPYSSATRTDVNLLITSAGFVTLSGSGFSAQKYQMAQFTCTITPAPGDGRGWNICVEKGNTCSSLGFSIYNSSTNATDNLNKDTVGVVQTIDVMFTPVNSPPPITKASCGLEIRYVPAFTP